ncbi:MAG TPA: DUF559 domain-containing protein [Myxococcaceae bacterium]|nr:DUF559 domain-containing protein [Myxococcaceae bacterium]
MFEKEVYERLTRAGYQATPQWPVGHYRIDLVVDGGGRRVAIECDGDRYHPLEKLQEDMARQAILERLGWRFVRIRGSAFFRNPRKAMDSVFARLSELGVTADRASKSPEATDANTSSLVREALVRRADELQRAWAEREAAVPSEGANGGASTGAPKKKTPFAGRTGWGRAKAGTPSEQAAPPTPPSKSEPEKPTPRVASAPPAAPAPSVAAAAPPPANPAPRASAIATALQASAIPPPKSGDPLPDTVTALLDAKAFSCPSCGGKRRLWVGRDGPLLKCEASACAKSEAVAVPVLSSALRQLGTRCDCGEPFKIVDMSAGRTFIGCSGYPTHRKSFGWLEFREHVKARAAKA